MTHDFGAIPAKQLGARVAAAKRALRIGEARTKLLPYIQLSMPDQDRIESDPLATKYEETAHGRLLCQVFEKVATGKLKRVAVSIPPQHGKTTVLGEYGPAWFAGRFPDKHIMYGTYNQDRANEVGGSVREALLSQNHSYVFTGYALRKAGKAVDYMVSEAGGKIAFVGVGGSGTGKPADIFIVDDPLKSEEEANSNSRRDTVWGWFNKVAFTRLHENSAVIVLHTRWHEDDLIGRLCDPEHPERNKRYKGVADKWLYIDLPAVVTDTRQAKILGLDLTVPDDPDVVEQFGKQPMSALWPGRKGLKFLAEAKNMDPLGFNALYMGRPAPDDGAFFKAAHLVEYDRGELPEKLRIYAASDHAVGTKQRNDPSVIGCVGVDENDDIWVLPDLVMDRIEPDEAVEVMLNMMRLHRPTLWWIEAENISRSFGPFLKKRMLEERVYCSLDPQVPSKDKATRARSIQARMAMGKVRFPKFAPWWPEARKQLLTFPSGAHDDFVDFMSWIGLGLLKETSAPAARKPANDTVPTNSAAWIMKQAAFEERQRRLRVVQGGRF